MSFFKRLVLFFFDTINSLRFKKIIKDEDKKYNDTLEPAFKDNPEVGTVGIYNKYTRLTFVCYLREKIANCPDEIDERFLTKSGHSKIKEEQEVI